MIKVAIAYKDGEIFEHFGHAETFAIYEYSDPEDYRVCEKKIVDVSAYHGHQAMADFMKDEGVDAVMAGNMGGEAKALLLTYGIVPVIGYCGNADTAADLLVTGQLPIVEGAGGCGGGCGGCGGGCGGCGGEGEEGGCGCGCDCH